MLIDINRQDPNLPIPMPVKDAEGKTESWLTYYFISVDPKDVHAAHVADVTEPSHIKRFLSLDDYSPYVGPEPLALVKPVAMPKPPKQNAAGKLGQHPAPVPYGKASELVRTAPAVEQESTIDFNSASANGLRVILESNPPVEDVKAALAKEKARTDAPPRKGWTDVAEAYVASKS